MIEQYGTLFEQNVDVVIAFRLLGINLRRGGLETEVSNRLLAVYFLDLLQNSGVAFGMLGNGFLKELNSIVEVALSGRMLCFDDKCLRPCFIELCKLLSRLG